MKTGGAGRRRDRGLYLRPGDGSGERGRRGHGVQLLLRADSLWACGREPGAPDRAGGDAQTAAQGNSIEAPPKPEHDRWVSHDPCVRHPHHRQRAAHRARDLAAASPCETRRCDEMLRH